MNGENDISVIFKSNFKLICFNCHTELEWIILTADIIKIKPCRVCQERLIAWARKDAVESTERRIREIGSGGPTMV